MPVNTESDGKGGLKAAEEKKGGNAVTDTMAQMAHKANPGIHISENLPEKANKEDLDKRMEELNKDK
ncbi:hypothetical protein BT63DRAFT_481937 [Microthyrium microscopicum]|uniref:Uncharacterized protein n=1 Tax=Microthyrium microscopicum TaxID=703497 RepID=A0A6A6U2J2_9PEZI|nr:hypothetical protein BT63DRAFT_481937 [Microthyrium microscopicum]